MPVGIPGPSETNRFRRHGEGFCGRYGVTMTPKPRICVWGSFGFGDKNPSRAANNLMEGRCERPRPGARKPAPAPDYTQRSGPFRKKTKMEGWIPVVRSRNPRINSAAQADVAGKHARGTVATAARRPPGEGNRRGRRATLALRVYMWNDFRVVERCPSTAGRGHGRVVRPKNGPFGPDSAFTTSPDGDGNRGHHLGIGEENF